MIVQCDKCRTKFRIADAKVSDSGVKVRCSRCAHVFIVKRNAEAMGGSTPGPSPQMSMDDPLGASIRPTIPPSSSSVRPMPDFSTYAPVAPKMSSAPQPQYSPTPMFSEPATVQASRPGRVVPNIPAASTTQDAMLALGFSPGSGPPAPPMNGPDPSRPPRSMHEISKERSGVRELSFDEEPTNAFDEGPTMRKEPEERFPASSSALPATSPFGSPPLALQNPPPSPFGAPAGSGAFNSPLANKLDELFGSAPPPGASLGRTQSEPMSALPKVSTSPGLAAMKSNPSMASRGGTNPSMAGRGGTNPQFDPSAPSGEPDGLTNPFFPPPPGIPAGGQQAAPSNGDALASGLSDLPGLFPLGLNGDDPFAGLDLSPGGGGYQGGDLAAPAPEMEPDAPSQGPGPGSPVARIDLGHAATPTAFENSLATTRVAAALPSPSIDVDTRSLPAEAMKRIGRWPTYLGLALGLLVTVFAVRGPAGGELSHFGPSDVVHLVRSPISEPIVEALSTIKARETHVTTYLTKSGRRLLVVAGYAYNDGKEGEGDLEVVAMVISGRDVIDRREARVGVTLPEDALTSVSTSAELESVYGAQVKNQMPGVLKAGAKLPFMVVFADPPDDLEHRSFHVEFRKPETGSRARIDAP
jgi:predicted Zn finger-like uncharacterized protein